MVVDSQNSVRAVRASCERLPDCLPRVMGTIDSHLESMKPFFDRVSIGILDLTVRSSSREGSPVAELIKTKCGTGDIVFFTGANEEFNRRIGTMPSSQLDIEDRFCLEVWYDI